MNLVFFIAMDVGTPQRRARQGAPEGALSFSVLRPRLGSLRILLLKKDQADDQAY